MERGLLRLPDSRNSGKESVLAAPALQVLASLPRVTGCPYVIVGENSERPRSDLKRPWAMITKAAGLDGVRIHDLRHTFASHGAAVGMGLTIVGRLLGHADVRAATATAISRTIHCDVPQMPLAAPWRQRWARPALTQKSSTKTSRNGGGRNERSFARNAMVCWLQSKPLATVTPRPRRVSSVVG